MGCSFSRSQGGKSTVSVFLNVKRENCLKHFLPHQCSVGCKNFTEAADFKSFPLILEIEIQTLGR